jgi:alpha-soluble NSF attachment protein
LSKYQGMDSSFSGTRECALIEKLIQAIENNDSEEFSQSLAEFDRMTKLDDWKTSLLLLVKRNIQSDGEEDYT